MIKPARALLIYTLSVTMVASQAFAAAPTSVLKRVPVTINSTIKANALYTSAGNALLRLVPNIDPAKRAAALKEKAVATLRASAPAARWSGRMLNEVIGFQAMAIMMSTLAFQATSEHRAMIGHSTQANAVEGDCTGGAFSALLCNGLFLFQSIAGSGEFWAGTAGTTGLLGVNSLSGYVLRKILGESTTRLGFFKYMGAIASSTLMMAGATSSSFLWTEAVKALPDAEQIHKAEGVAGRALVSMGNWEAFKQTDDGKIFSAIMENMWNILIVDSELRTQWVYNTWRFGIARGEFAVAVSSIMGANALGAAAGGIWGGPAFGFVVGIAIGVGAMSLLFAADAPNMLTRAMQSMRSFSASTGMRRSRNELKALVYSAFDVSRFQQSADPNYERVFGGFIKERLESEQNARERLANIAIERYYELLNAQRKVEEDITVIESTLRSQAVLNNLVVQVGGTYMSYMDAVKKVCEERGNCDASIAAQLEKLKPLREQVAQSRSALTEIVRAIYAEYIYDFQMIQEMWDSQQLTSFPFSISDSLGTFQTRSETVGKGVAATLAGSDAQVARNMGFEVNERQIQTLRLDLSAFYTQSFLEKKYFEEQQEVAGQ